MPDGGVLNVPEYLISDGPTTFRWAQNPRPLRYFRLTIDDGLNFKVEPIIVLDTDNVGDEGAMEQLAARIAKERAAEVARSREPEALKRAFDTSVFDNFEVLVNLPFFKQLLTPFDVQVPQCWLLLELDMTLPWEWMRDRAAVTAKHPDPVYVGPYNPAKVHHNVWLRHVYPDGGVQADPTARPNDSYSFVFFGVVHRTGDDSVPPALGSHLMNFRLRFTGGAKPLPMTADPDVGNDGNEEFPIPP